MFIGSNRGNNDLNISKHITLCTFVLHSANMADNNVKLENEIDEEHGYLAPIDLSPTDTHKYENITHIEESSLTEGDKNSMDDAIPDVEMGEKPDTLQMDDDDTKEDTIKRKHWSMENIPIEVEKGHSYERLRLANVVKFVERRESFAGVRYKWCRWCLRLSYYGPCL